VASTEVIDSELLAYNSQDWFSVVAKGRSMPPPERTKIEYSCLLTAESVIHRTSKLLLASKVTFRGLDRYMAEQELNLVQLTTGEMTEPGARSSQIMRCELSMPAALLLL